MSIMQTGQTNGPESLLRCSDDDFSVDKLLVELAVLTLLVGGGYQRVALVLNPFPDTQLVLRGTEQTRLLSRVLVALIGNFVS